MNDDLSARFADLLDPDIQYHVIEVMKEWCDGTYSVLNTSRADLVEAQISKPLKFWIDEIFKENAASNNHVIEAANEFAIKANNIVYILRYKTRPLYPEHAALLNDAWSDFQRSMVYGLHIRNRILKEIIVNPPDVSAAVDEEIQRRIEEENQQAEAKRQETIKKWSNSGALGAKESRLNRVEILLMLGNKVLEEENRNEIRSIRNFAKKIANKVKEGNFSYETSKGRKEKLRSGSEAIRKFIEIKNLHKEYFNNN